MRSHTSPNGIAATPNSAARSRSRSPIGSSRQSKHRHRDDDDHDRHQRHRHSHSHSHRRTHDRPSKSARECEPSAPIILPFNARQLGKRDLRAFEPMFAMYLDIQKGLLLEDLSEDEVKGRWKSFTGKWNRGELAEGWYDPSTLEKAQKSAASVGPRDSPNYQRPVHEAGTERSQTHGDEYNTGVEEDGDDEYGPMPHYGPAAGPTIPTMQDLDLRKESAIEDSLAERHDARRQRRAEIRTHKAELRHLEEEVAPRAEPGTHERKVEKRREAAAANKAFAESRRGGSPEAAPDDELMGSGENDLEAIKSAREREQRKKNEREIRREEILRARTAEREERVKRYKEKEEETIGWLKTLAKQRFG
ncbi:hypothetical protein ASPCAL11098 [Aspergillus calidoustus]|uniref:RNA helicase HEL117 n=1 Tax=Aspergillus calidoustus TaxID=454130 RepID=A0A0U5GBW0_ASPCI|nr:hypothetical protein ASPCAL11098 [Aspergillus calidoustus]